MNKTPVTKAISHIEEILDIAELDMVAYPRPELAGGCGEIWDITLPDEQTTVRIAEWGGEVDVYLFSGGGKNILEGHMKMIGRMAAPTYVAMIVDQLVADYL